MEIIIGDREKLSETTQFKPRPTLTEEEYYQKQRDLPVSVYDTHIYANHLLFNHYIFVVEGTLEYLEIKEILNQKPRIFDCKQVGTEIIEVPVTDESHTERIYNEAREKLNEYVYQELIKLSYVEFKQKAKDIEKMYTLEGANKVRKELRIHRLAIDVALGLAMKEGVL